MNRRKGLVHRIAVASMAISLALSATGCQFGPPAQQGGKIAVIAQAQGVQFWDLLKEGAQDAGSEIGYEIDYSCAQAASDWAGQKELIQKALDEHVDGIVLAPNSPTELSDVLQAAGNAEIPVIVVSSNVNYPGVQSYIGSDNTNAGMIAGREAVAELGASGNVGIIGHSNTASNALSRIEGFESALSQLNGPSTFSTDADGNVVTVTKYNVVKKDFSNGQRDGTKDTAINMIQSNPEINLIFATNENSTLGVCDAIVELGKIGEIKVIGFNASDDELTYIKNGTLSATVVQSPYNMGYLGVRYIDAFRSGESLAKTYDTGAMIVNSSNINDEIIQLWVSPQQN